MKKLTTTIAFECEDEVSLINLREYIVYALESWGGQRHPDDPLFGSLEKVRVGRFTRADRTKKKSVAGH